jgi:hypothetical protein
MERREFIALIGGAAAELGTVSDPSERIEGATYAR